MHDFTEVHARLWIGSAMGLAPCDFDVVVTVCEEHEVWFGVAADRFFDIPMEDETPPDPAVVAKAVRKVVKHHRKGRSVLVRCRVGRERSAMVVALALVELTGCTPSNAVLHLRKVHWPSVLASPARAMLPVVMQYEHVF